jgi:hypothetical protein
VRSRIVSDTTGTLVIALAPYESRFLLRRSSQPRGGRLSAEFTGSGPARTPDMFVEPSGESRVLGPWAVRVDGAAWTTEGDSMHGWHTRPEHQHFSGAAAYETTLDVQPEPHGRRWLTFGDPTPVAPHPRRNGYRAWLDTPVRDAAVVRVNGRRVGSVWAPPFRIEVSDALRPGVNTIHVEVANTAMNHMAGQSRPNYRLLNLRYGERFAPQDMDQVQVLPSGLMAPVRLVTEAR